MKRKILFIFLLVFLVRVVALDQSFWLDEGTTARVVKTLSYTQILTQFSPHDFHPPLYYFSMKLWTSVFGYSEVSLRMPSVLFSLLTGYLVYLLGKKLRGEKTGIWALVFFLFNPLIVYYSQEARMYMMVTFLITASLYFLIKNSYILFVFFFALALFVFYGSVFFALPILMHFLYKKKYRHFFIMFFVIIISFLVLSPLLREQLANAKISLSQVARWDLVLGKANLKNLLLIPVKFSFGRISFYPKIFYYFIVGLWAGFVWFFALKGGIKNKFFLFIIFSVIMGGLTISFFVPLLQYFRFLYLVPIVSILLSFGLSRRPANNLAGYLLSGGFVLLSLWYLLNPMFHREDWKGLANGLPKGIPVYMVVSSSDALRYYRQDLRISELASLRNAHEKEIAVIPYTSELYGIDYESRLKEEKFTLKSQRSLRGITYEIWSH